MGGKVKKSSNFGLESIDYSTTPCRLPVIPNIPEFKYRTKINKNDINFYYQGKIEEMLKRKCSFRLKEN